MRIALLAHKLSFAGDYRQTGVSRYIEFLLQNLPSALGEQDQLLAFSGPDVRASGRAAEFDRSIIWNWSRWPTGRVPIRVVWEQLAAPLSIWRSGADVVHGPVNVVPQIVASRSIVTIHDLAFLAFPEQYPPGQRRYLTLLTRASAKRSRRVITVSDFTRQDVIERLGIHPDRVVAVPNGVSDHFYPRGNTQALAEFRASNSLPADFLLFVGTLQPRKNLLGLLRAYAGLDRSIRPPLYVVGSPGWMYAKVFDEVRRLGVAGDVNFAGFVTSEDLPLWYSAATAFVYPSYYEGFGLPVLEAMACGTPVVTSNVTSLPEVAGDAAIMVDPKDPGTIAEGLESILANVDLRATLAARGLKRARSFSWDRTAKLTAAVYRTVAEQAGPH